MFLKRGIFINWGNIPQLEFDFGPINLFSGGNGSGKTTAADAIQSLMTAAHENLFTYNPGQDETTQRGRGGKQVRTLASYLLGCDDGSYSRPDPTDGYVAGIFHPTEGESGEAFTAVMAMRGHLDNAGNRAQARLDSLTFMIIPGEQLSLSHFIKDYLDGQHVVPVTDISGLLKKQYGNTAVEVYDKKRPYLRRLFGILRGKKEAVSDREAMHAARTFSNFMAYKPVKSINDFVAREILEPRDLGDAIRSVSDLMKTIHGMEDEAKRIVASVDILSRSKQLTENYLSRWTERGLAGYCQASAALLLNQQHYLAAKKQQQSVADDIENNQTKITSTEQRQKQAHAEIVSIEAQRQGIQALKDKDQLEANIKNLTQQLVAQAQPLLEQDQQIASNIDSTRKLQKILAEYSLAVDIPELDSSEFRKQGKALLASAEHSRIDLQQLMGKDWIDMAPLEGALEQAAQTEQCHNRWAALLHNAEFSNQGISLRDQLARLHTRQEQQQQQLLRQIKQKEQDIQMLQGHKVNYPPYVELAVAAIREQCPKADPQVLCDFVEVLEPQWQMAIEGYIGGARYSILVEQDFEAEAIAIVRQLPGGRRNKAKVIQGSKAQRDADRGHLPKQSVIEVMRFSHKIAEYYLKASYGNVLRVNDANELRNTARGVSSEGLGSGNYSMWRCDIDESELVFGQGARQRAMLAKQNELDALLFEASHLKKRGDQLSELFTLVDNIAAIHSAQLIEKMLSIHRQLQSTESSLNQLDLSDFEELEQQLSVLQSQFDELQQQAKTLEQQQGALQERLRQQQRKVLELADSQEALQDKQQQQEQAINDIAKLYPAFNADQQLLNAEQRVSQAAGEFDFNEEIDSLSQQLDQADREIFKVVQEHNQHCNPADSIVYGADLVYIHSVDFFKRIVSLQVDIEQIHNRLKNNVLVERHEKLKSLRDSFNTAFVTNLCHSIYQSINDGKRILDDLNVELEHHRFGADKESYRFDYNWVPEYREYWRFFKEVIALPNLGDGNTLFDAELSEQGVQVRDKLLSMLLDKDEQVALRELERISDYRHYRNYEIYKQPAGKAPIALSQYGTGSGGQLETPAYIIRSAAVCSAFRFNEGNTQLRMVMVDEAFSKMDETRSREVINYLTETLGLQLIFIMPSAKSGPFLDLISNQFVFSKCPTTQPIGQLNTRVLVDRKECNREKIQALWANHRQMVRQQAMLDFMDDVIDVEASSRDSTMTVG